MTKSVFWPLRKNNSLYSQSVGMERFHGLITFTALLGILFATLMTTAILVLVPKTLSLEVSSQLGSLLQFTLFIVFVWLYAKHFEKRSFASLGFFGKHNLRDYLAGATLGLLLLSVSLAAIALSAKITVAITPNLGVRSVLSVLGAMGFFAIQGASEEILMRGWFMQSIAIRHRPWLGIVLSALIFTLLHAANPSLSAVAVANLFLIGLFLAVLALYNGNLWGACGFHSAWNFVMNSVYGIPVSGNSPMGRPIMQTRLEGNELITGGGFGPEGSVVVAGAVAAATVLLVALKRESSAPSAESL